MKMKTILAVLFSIALLGSATVGSAQSGRQHGARGGDMNNQAMGMMDLLVAPDGTVITVRTAAGTGTGTTNQQDIVAINTTGSVAWSWHSDKGMQFTELSGNLVLVASGYGMQYSNGTTNTSSELVALSLSNGSVQWRLTLDGFAMEIEPAQNQIYAIVTKPSTTGPTGTGPNSGGMGSGSMGNGGMGSGGMMNGDRKLVAISNSGVILWSVPLSN